MSDYKLELHTKPVIRTHWWKDLDQMVPANVWWLTGGGLSRPATPIEVEFWLRGEQKLCDKLGSCKRTEGHAGSCNTTRGE